MFMLDDLRSFFRLSRPLNVAIALLSYAIACYFTHRRDMSYWQDGLFWSEFLCLLAISASGYWINDVYDFRIDRINKPDKLIVNAVLSVKKVMTAYISTTVLCAIFSYLVFVKIYDKPIIFFVNILSITLLWIYAAWLKRVSMVGNVVIAFLTSLVILVAGHTYGFNVPQVWMAIFAFEVTLLREIAKDTEDIEGDVAYGLQTLPIQIGLNRTRYVLLFFYTIFLISCWMPFLIKALHSHRYIFDYLIFSFFAVQIPTLWLMRRSRSARTPADFGLQSHYLKLLIFSGIGSLLFL